MPASRGGSDSRQILPRARTDTKSSGGRAVLGTNLGYHLLGCSIPGCLAKLAGKLTCTPFLNPRAREHANHCLDSMQT